MRSFRYKHYFNLKKSLEGTPLYKNETNLKELPHVTCLELLKHGKEALGLI